jgi:hypothetical protein
MSEYKGVAEYPNKQLLKELWQSGLRQKGILEYLEANDLPMISGKALAKYGQRNWNEREEVEQHIDMTESDSMNVVKETIDDIVRNRIGDVERVSISKTGFNISIKPRSNVEEIDLPKVGPRKAPNYSLAKKSDVNYHVFIPDTQIEVGRPNDHLLWISQYLKDRFSGQRITLVHAGDHWNMGSLSSYDRGTGKMEGRRYIADIQAGNEAFEILDSQIADEPWDKHFLFGNHEERIAKAANSNIQLDGVLSLDHCITPPTWDRHKFLVPVTIDGVTYAHYFYNPNTSKPYGGIADTRLKIIGHSFVMGHQQGLQIAMRHVKGQQQVGIVAGSCYQHSEEYAGPQGNDHWQGIVVLENVENGSFDPHPVSLDQLCKTYEGHSLKDHKPKIL